MQFEYNLYDTTFLAKELSVKSYKNLLKSIYSDEPDQQIFLRNFISLFHELSLNSNFTLQSLTFEQLFLFLFQLRVNTFGSSCKLILTSKDQENKRNLFFNIEQAIQDILILLNEVYIETFEDEETQIVLKIPCVARFLSVANTKEEYLSYFYGCHLKQKNLNVTIHTNEEAKQIIDILPVKIINKIFEFQKNYKKALTEVNFLSPYQDCNSHLGIEPNLSLLIKYTKLFFPEELTTFYNNLFYISKLANIDLNYLELECTPGEYLFFTKKLIDKKEDSSNTQTEESQEALTSSEVDNLE
jgi:hypothetical protein